MASITQSLAWKTLIAHRTAFDYAAFRKVVDGDEKRLEDFSLSVGGLHADYSRSLVSRETLALLLKLAETANVEDLRRQLFDGSLVNNTERRAALHTLLRGNPVQVPQGLESQAQEVSESLARMGAFTTAVHEDKRFTES